LLGRRLCANIPFVVRVLPGEKLGNKSNPEFFMGKGNNSQRKETKKPKKKKEVQSGPPQKK